jgi:hypothetical protein
MSNVREFREVSFMPPVPGRFCSSLLKMICVVQALWCALPSWRRLAMLLWIISLLDEKAATIVSGLSWSGEADACAAHRLQFDMSLALLAVGTSEWSREGRPFTIRSVAGNRLTEEVVGVALRS